MLLFGVYKKCLVNVSLKTSHERTASACDNLSTNVARDVDWRNQEVGVKAAGLKNHFTKWEIFQAQLRLSTWASKDRHAEDKRNLLRAGNSAERKRKVKTKSECNCEQYEGNPIEIGFWTKKDEIGWV